MRITSSSSRPTNDRSIFGPMRTLLFPAALSLTLPLLAQLGPEHRFIYPSTGTALAVHDMDGDGDGDVLRATAAGLLLSEQVAPGEFSVTRVLAPASGALRLGFGDLDGDGIDDVLIPDATGSTIAWVRVLGGGSYGTPATAVDGLSGPLQATAADVDGDGDQDLLIADDNAGTLVIAWAENQGGGLFAAPITISTSGLPFGAQLQVMLFDHGDIDGDGDEDLVSLYPTPQWYRNDGAGTFTGEPLTSVSTAGDLVLADIDGDDDLDLWVVHGPGEIRKTLNNGDGSFAPEQVAYQEGNYLIHSLAVGDRDGDGDPDLFGMDTNIGWPVEVFVLLNDGTGTLVPGDHFGYSDDSYQPYALGAIDTDVVQDVVAFTNDVTTVFLSAGGGTFPISSVQQPRQLTVIGRDVVVSGPQSWGPTHRGNRPLQAARHTNVGTGLRQQPIPLWVSASPIERTDTADLNGDGITDLVMQWQEPLTGTWRRSFWMNGTDSVTAIGEQFFPTADPYPLTPCISDLDNDGDNDMARIFQGDLKVMLNDGIGAFATQNHWVSTVSLAYGPGIADLSGDGLPDYLWAHSTLNGPDSLTWAENDGTSEPSTRHSLLMPIHRMPVSGNGGLGSPLIAAADLDSDGTQEIVLFNGDSLAVLHNTGGALTPAQSMAVNTRIYALADMDVDGLQDLVLLHRDGTLGLCPGISGALFGPEEMLGSTFSSSTGLALGDMNDDGRPDVIVCSPDEGYAAWFGVDLATSVEERPAATASILVMPNPATSSVRLVFEEVLSATDHVSLTDASGRVVRIVSGTGARELRLERSGLATGVYVVRAVRDGRPIGVARLALQ